MAELQLGVVESKFADIIWRTAPVTSSQLVKLGEAELGWKRTTVHTVLRRLCDSMWRTALTGRCRRLSRPLRRAGS